MPKSPILLLHGALSSQTQFRNHFAQLTVEYDIHAITFSGHGEQGISNLGFNLKAFMQNVWDYLEKHELNQPAVFGYSMGGYIALNCEIERPDTFSKIITLGTKITWNAEIADREKKLLDPVVMTRKVPSFAQMLEKLHTGIGWERLLAETGSFMDELATSNYLTESALSTIRIPVTFGHGELDKTVSREETEWAAKAVKNSKVEILENAPHAFEKLKVEDVFGLIQAAL